MQYAGLPGSPWYERAERYSGGRGAGSVPAFIIKGGLEAGQRFVEGLQLHSHVANIGDVRSLVIHPASTTHSQLTERGAGRAPASSPAWCACRSASRSIDDIIADLEAGFRAAKL